MRPREPSPRDSTSDRARPFSGSCGMASDRRSRPTRGWPPRCFVYTSMTASSMYFLSNTFICTPSIYYSIMVLFLSVVVCGVFGLHARDVMLRSCWTTPPRPRARRMRGPTGIPSTDLTSWMPSNRGSKTRALASFRALTSLPSWHETLSSKSMAPRGT